MVITGIEVIRGNPGVAGNPVAMGVPVGETLPVEVGDTVRVHMTVDYRGMAIDSAVWTAIGWQVGVVIPEFTEVFNSRTPVNFDESLDFVTYPIVCDVPITDISGFFIEFALYGNVLDMYAKIMEVPGPDIFTDIYPAAIELIEVPLEPEYELLEHTIYPYAYIYDGDAEFTTLTFKSDPFTPAAWIAGKVAAAVESEVRKAGGRIMEMRVYCDKGPLLWTNWRIETVTRTETTGVASLGIWWLGPAILLALAIILIVIVATLVIKPILASFKRNPELHDVKPAWGKETLMLAIHDSEVFWERPLTPTETLEGMSEAELRDHLDKIAEEEVPPEVSWLPLAIIGGLGVLGVGVAVALAARPRE